MSDFLDNNLIYIIPIAVLCIACIALIVYKLKQKYTNNQHTSLLKKIYPCVEDLTTAIKKLSDEDMKIKNGRQIMSAMSNRFIFKNSDRCIFLNIQALEYCRDMQDCKKLILKNIHPKMKCNLMLQYVFVMKCLRKEIDCDYVDDKLMEILNVKKNIRKNKFMHMKTIEEIFNKQLEKEGILYDVM